MADEITVAPEHKDFIVNAVDEIEKKTGKAALLSRVGLDFSKQYKPFKQIYKLSLSNFISENLTDLVRFVEGRETGASAALETVKFRKNTNDQQKVNLDIYPRALVIAFCLQVPDDREVYFSIEPPYRYSLLPAADPAPGPNFCKISRDNCIGKRSTDLTNEDRHAVAERISNWINENGLQRLVRAGHPEAQRPASDLLPLTALDRLINAQPAELREKLLIPLDLAGLLASRR